MKTLEQEFRAFCGKAFPDQQLGTAQLAVMRAAFFAGAASFFDLTMRFTGPGYSEDDGVAAMGQLQAELTAFANEVKAGKR
jgi:hypothetical protein